MVGEFGQVDEVEREKPLGRKMGGGQKRDWGEASEEEGGGGEPPRRHPALRPVQPRAILEEGTREKTNVAEAVTEAVGDRRASARQPFQTQQIRVAFSGVGGTRRGER